MSDQIAIQAITIEDVRQMEADGVSREVVDGCWIDESQERDMASKRHGEIAAKINYFLVDYVMKNAIGTVYADQTTYVLDMRENQVNLIRIPDVSFVKSERIDKDSPDDFHYIAPDLVIEVISPSERIGNVQSKVDDYLTYGTEQVWCIYPDKERVVVHFPDWTTKAYKIGDVIPGNPSLLKHFFRRTEKIPSLQHSQIL